MPTIHPPVPPCLPSSTAPIPDSLASQVRDPLSVQAELTAIQIAALKRLPRKSKVLIMDS